MDQEQGSTIIVKMPYLIVTYMDKYQKAYINCISYIILSNPE